MPNEKPYADFGCALTYRPEIDGLRALAVLPVVVFHAEQSWAPGGYVGVNIFFVISGYLIARIVSSEIAAGHFTFASFYARRMRRILPAFLAVIVASLATAYVVFTPHDFELLGRSALAALGLHANYWFAGKAGYFMPEAATMPLLHTWSLSVEEQFYIVAPLLVAAATRVGKVRAIAIFTTLVLIALAWSEIDRHAAPEASFFTTQTRVFELLLGMGLGLGLLPALSSQHLRSLLALAGVFTILIIILSYGSDTPFPGLGALIPCLAAAAILHGTDGTDRRHSVVVRALTSRPAVYIGKRSYSLYLWHWPLFAFAQYELGHQISIAARIALVVTAFAIAELSYRFIEQPFRQRRADVPSKATFVTGAAASGALAGAAALVVASDGLPSRLPPAARALAEQIDEIDKTRSWQLCREAFAKDHQPCRIGAPNVAPRLIVWGDSHAGIFLSVIDEGLRQSGRAAIAIVRGGCPALLELEEMPQLTKRKCAAQTKAFLSALEMPGLETVLLATRWGNYTAQLLPNAEKGADEHFAQRLLNTVAGIQSKVRRVVIVGPVPETGYHLPAAMIRAAMAGQTLIPVLPLAQFLTRQRHVLEALQQLEAVDGVRVLYPHREICDAAQCSLTQNGLPLYRDDNHLNALGRARLSRLIQTAVSE